MHFERNSLLGMEKRNCRILTVWRRIPCERCKWAAEEYSGGLRLCGGSRKSHDFFVLHLLEGRKIVTGGTESAFPISFCLHRLRKEGAMGILLDEPKYPVIDRAPSAGTTISNFNLADWLRVTAITSASIPVGYLAGGSVNIRGPSMYTAGLIGLMGGFMYAYQCSAGRLMGMFPNDDEVARYKR